MYHTVSIIATNVAHEYKMLTQETACRGDMETVSLHFSQVEKTCCCTTCLKSITVSFSGRKKMIPHNNVEMEEGIFFHL